MQIFLGINLPFPNKMFELMFFLRDLARISQVYLEIVASPVIASDSEAVFWRRDCFVAPLLAMTF